MSLSENTRRRTIAAAAAAAALIGAGTGAGTVALLGSSSGDTVVRQVTVAAADDAAVTSGGLTAAEIYERSYKGVVEVTVGGAAETPFGEQQSQGQGSGFVYDDEGTIVTNQHVVDGADSITVTFWDGSKAQARLVGSDASTDVAVLDVDVPREKLQPLELGDSGDLAVGEAVVAIGSPFGLEETLTTGVVSALDREITAPNDFAIAGAIQTDAAINHGNSGGPLLDAQGRVIGINSQIESESGGSDGIGFAVPSNTLAPVVAELLADGEVEHAYLGVSLESAEEGVAVTSVVASSPAAEAGVRSGDVIVAFDGRDVASSSELRVLVDAKRPGDTVTLTVLRSGERVEVEIELGARPS
jgi:putative serine protease PepD